jgi:hypothetical protein
MFYVLNFRVDDRLGITSIKRQQLRRHKAEEILHFRVREQERLNIADLETCQAR